jgi:hypothetical protein
MLEPDVGPRGRTGVRSLAHCCYKRPAGCHDCGAWLVLPSWAGRRRESARGAIPKTGVRRFFLRPSRRQIKSWPCVNPKHRRVDERMPTNGLTCGEGMSALLALAWINCHAARSPLRAVRGRLRSLRRNRRRPQTPRLTPQDCRGLATRRPTAPPGSDRAGEASAPELTGETAKPSAVIPLESSQDHLAGASGSRARSSTARR